MMGILESLWFLMDTRTVLITTGVLLVFLWLFSKPRNLPPGPWGLPIIGSVPALMWGLHRDVYVQLLLRRYAQKYGSVFRLKVFNKTLIILNDYKSIRSAFQHPQLSDRPDMLLTEIYKSEGVAMASGEAWTELRRFCLTVLRSFGVGKSSFEEKIGTEAEELLKEMFSFGGKPFKPNTMLDSAVSNVICSVVFGKRYEYSDQDFSDLLNLLGRTIASFGAGGALNFLPALRYMPFMGVDSVVLNFEEFAKFIGNVIDTHRASFDENNPRDLTDVYLMEIQKGQLNGEKAPVTNGTKSHSSRRHLSERNLVGTIANLFAAGSGTTSGTLQWCLYYMMTYPDIQKRVQAEIDDVVGRNRLPRLADKPELNFTQAVIWEVQRLTTVTPVGVPHAAASDTVINGFVVPKGSILVANLWAVSHDPKLWPEPDEFKPERFLNEEGNAIKAEEFIPFSTGRRSCIGEHLAKMELYVFFSYFMHQFDVRKPDGSSSPPLKGERGIFHFPPPFEVCVVRRD
ncbi:cytochrome P450 2J6-like [Asterias rubens]|uniref:cytochrome P450 2J6-like n=1 Tax=Asterias rubens TaxID=7604 RepID=UPI001454FB47|nr:cytochrome P450 2J6-like [Asterias rubens]